MNNQERLLDIYLMGIGGTGMGAFAGLLKQKGHRVEGSDLEVYSPMKEKLADWGISYRSPYSSENLPAHCDLVIVGNVIRKENPEALAVVAHNLPHDSFPAALHKLFLRDAIPVVATGTHGKTTCSALLAHCFFSAKRDPGFLIGGIPINFNESFRASQQKMSPFVVEGDEYDTAFFDKRPKFMHYDPRFLLITSLEFDHADIYADLDAIIDAFSLLLKQVSSDVVVVFHNDDPNIHEAIKRSKTKAKLMSYGDRGDYEAGSIVFDQNGLSFDMRFKEKNLGRLHLPLFGQHNLKNATGCYGILHSYGLSHEEIAIAFSSFKGVKRRLEERFNQDGVLVVDDFAHHPTAVFETIKGAKQRYPHKKICAIFEPRSASSCLKLFQERYIEAFHDADKVMLLPLGRSLPKHQGLDTSEIAARLSLRGINANAYDSYQELGRDLFLIKNDYLLLFMSNGDFHGLLRDVLNVVNS